MHGTKNIKLSIAYFPSHTHKPFDKMDTFFPPAAHLDPSELSSVTDGQKISGLTKLNL